MTLPSLPALVQHEKAPALPLLGFLVFTLALTHSKAARWGQAVVTKGSESSFWSEKEEKHLFHSLEKCLLGSLSAGIEVPIVRTRPGWVSVHFRSVIKPFLKHLGRQERGTISQIKEGKRRGAFSDVISPAYPHRQPS